jgi:DsbC/DsbD-like thiol-disulfide interchange protein
VFTRQTTSCAFLLVSGFGSLLFLIFAATLPDWAATVPHGTVELVAEDQSIAPGRTLYVGLHFQLEKGWHTYWVNPGDSGEPLRAAWHLPAGMAAGEVQWPAPKRFGSPTIADFGYDGETTLLVPIHSSASLKPENVAQIAADLGVLICREICIPGKAHVSLSLPIKPEIPEPDVRSRGLFAAVRGSLPCNAPSEWKVTVLDEADSFVLIASPGRAVNHAAFFPLVESQVDNAAPQKIEQAANGFRLTLRKSDQLLKPVKRLKGVLELSANESYVIDAPVGNTRPAK